MFVLPKILSCPTRRQTIYFENIFSQKSKSIELYSIFISNAKDMLTCVCVYICVFEGGIQTHARDSQSLLKVDE